MTPPFTDLPEPPHGASPTAHLLEELQLYGHRPLADESDPRPLPDADQAASGIGAAMENLAALLADTRLEDDLDDLLWNIVNVFHRKIASLDRLILSPLVV